MSPSKDFFLTRGVKEGSSDGLIVRDYPKQNWLGRRKALCDYLLVHHDVQMTKIEVKLEWLHSYIKKIEGRIHQINYSGPVFYELHEGYSEYPESVEYNGLNFDKKWNTRDIELSEGVFEFEKGKTFEENIRATWAGCIDLVKAGVHFAVFFAQGMRTPHIHCYGLFPEVTQWDEKNLTYILFAQKVFSIEIRHLLDLSLGEKQTIALEFAKHWRTGKMKKLLFEHIPGGKNADC